MKEYKVGDTVKVDMRITQIESGLYKLERNGNVYWTSDDILKRQEQDKTYDDGLNDAWEACRKFCCGAEMGGLSENELQEIFGNIFGSNYLPSDIFVDHTPQDAIDKIKAWEDKNSIRAGDIVRIKETGIEGVVTRIEYGSCSILKEDGFNYYSFDNTDIEKTGRKVDVSEIFKIIRGE